MKRLNVSLLGVDGLAFLKVADADEFELRFKERLPKPRFYRLRLWLSRWLPEAYPSQVRIWALRVSADDARRLAGTR